MIEEQKKNLENYADWTISDNRVKRLKRVLSELGLEKQWFRRKFCGDGVEITYHFVIDKRFSEDISDFISPRLDADATHFYISYAHRRDISDPTNLRFYADTIVSLFAESTEKALPVYKRIEEYLRGLQKVEKAEGKNPVSFRCVTQLGDLK